MKALLVGVIVLAMLTCSTREFPPLANITRVDVRTNRDRLGTITDPRRIAAIVAFVNARRSGWGRPLGGVPIGQIGVTFYQGGSLRGSFNAGPGFFDTQREGDFCSRDATTDEVVRFRALLAPFTEPTVE